MRFTVKFEIGGLRMNTIATWYSQISKVGKTWPVIVLILGLAGCGTNTAPVPNHNNQQQSNSGVQSPTGTKPDDSKPPVQQPESTKRQTVTLYFPDVQLLNLYKEKQEVSYQTDAELPKKTLEAWIQGPKTKKLAGLLPADVKVEYVKDLGNHKAEVSFSRELKNWNHGSTGEGMLAEVVPLILQPFGFIEVTVLVEGKNDETVFSHMGAGCPFKAANPDKYQWIQE